jgi:hypothetical protein
MALVVLVLLALPACGGPDTPTAPTTTDLTGRWTGTSTYPNAPFQLQLTQAGSALRGQYADGLDRSISVTGTFSDAQMRVVVDFGDAKLNLDGSVVDTRTVQGTMYTSALGNKQFPFTMTR